VRPPAGERGQASVELAASADVAVVVSLLALQLLAAGYAAVMADHAAEAGALALANGRPAADAARSAVPGWPHGAAHVQVEGDTVRVTLEPPSPFAYLRGRLSATGRAVVRRQFANAGRWDR
jgi:pyrimidine deaminase RibD-like protein